MTRKYALKAFVAPSRLGMGILPPTPYPSAPSAPRSSRLRRSPVGAEESAPSAPPFVPPQKILLALKTPTVFFDKSNTDGAPFAVTSLSLLHRRPHVIMQSECRRPRISTSIDSEASLARARNTALSSISLPATRGNYHLVDDVGLARSTREQHCCYSDCEARVYAENAWRVHTSSNKYDVENK